MKNLKEEILKHLPASAKTLAEKLKVSRVSVYRALKAHRPRLEREKVREGATGPMSVVWSEARSSASTPTRGPHDPR
jgi:hypothetical protein